MLTFLISFVGSLHPGPISFSVIEATLRRGLRQGIWVAVGSCVPEVIYGLLAVRGVRLFEQMPELYRGLQIAIVPVMLILGILALRRPKAAGTPVASETVVASQFSFGKGLTLSLLNPQLLPFWLVILVYYGRYEALHVATLAQQIAFVAGASLGAFALLALCIWLVHRRRERIERYLRPELFDRIIGWSFIGLAIWQSFTLFFT
ncbi:MAG: LysE family translocator [Cytophagaceae bacterium]|nr:LysE family translocator [Cytophagaceae bacterium]